MKTKEKARIATGLGSGDSQSGSAHSSETWSHVRTISLSSAVAERRYFLATLTRASYRSRSRRTGTAAGVRSGSRYAGPPASAAAILASVSGVGLGIGEYRDLAGGDRGVEQIGVNVPPIHVNHRASAEADGNRVGESRLSDSVNASLFRAVGARLLAPLMPFENYSLNRCHFGTPYLANVTVAPRHHVVNNLYLGLWG